MEIRGGGGDRLIRGDCLEPLLSPILYATNKNRYHILFLQFIFYILNNIFNIMLNTYRRTRDLFVVN